MKLQKLKHKLYLLIPKKFQKKVKNFYYDYILCPLYNLKYRVYYGFGDFFDSIAIETTTYCNLRCKFCPNSKYERGLLKNKKLMDLSLFKKIINELSEVNYRGQVLFHFYGEPLSDERLAYLVSYSRKKLPNSKLQINSNGFLITNKLYEELINSGVNRFLITQYGNAMPKPVKELFGYLKTKPREENKIDYRILGKDLGLSNRGGEIEVEKVVDYERPICLYPDVGINVDYEGNIVLCCNDYHSSVKFGNIKNEKIVDIWRKPYYKRIRKELKKKIFKLPICKKCVGIEK